MTRVQVLDYPVAHPGKCALCGGNTRRDGRQYVDIGVSVKMYGAVYFCTHCLAEIMGQLEWINPEEATKIQQNYSFVRSRLEKVEAENAKLRSALAELDFLGANLPAYSHGVGGKEPGDSQLEDAGVKSLNSPERGKGSEERTIEPSDVGRRKDVRDPELSKLLGGSI